MAQNYLSDPIEMTWFQAEHETFVTLADRIEDYLNAKFDSPDVDEDRGDYPSLEDVDSPLLDELRIANPKPLFIQRDCGPDCQCDELPF